MRGRNLINNFVGIIQANKVSNINWCNRKNNKSKQSPSLQSEEIVKCWRIEFVYLLCTVKMLATWYGHPPFRR